MEKNILEAALFMAGRPLNLDELAKIAGIHSLGYVKDLLEKLEKDYKGRGIQIVQTARGWEMQIKQEYLPKVAHLTPYSDVSEGAKRSLALIVAKEPIKQIDLIKMQGNKAYSYVRELEKMGLVRSERHGRSRVLSLTHEFERYFGEGKKEIKKKLQESLNIPREKIHDFIEARVVEQELEQMEKKGEEIINEDIKAKHAIKSSKRSTKRKKKPKPIEKKPEKVEEVIEESSKTASDGEIPW